MAGAAMGVRAVQIQDQRLTRFQTRRAPPLLFGVSEAQAQGGNMPCQIHWTTLS